MMDPLVLAFQAGVCEQAADPIVLPGMPFAVGSVTF